jgi:predicted AAA+ superfamily ATPase
MMGYRTRFISGVLENMVMLELKRRGYRVFVGKSDEKEIDFVGELKNDKVYIQVAYKMTDQSTIDREYNPLLEIKDHYPKFVVTMDDDWHDNIQGIRHKHIADFLLMNELI